MAAACMQASSSSSRQQQGTDSRQILRGLRCPQKVGFARIVVIDLSDEVKLRWIQFISVKLTVAPAAGASTTLRQERTNLL